MIKQLKNKLAITLQNTISELGFVPDEIGEDLKKIIGGNDEIAIMSLGCHLEDCIKDKSYDSLAKNIKSILEVQGMKAQED